MTVESNPVVQTIDTNINLKQRLNDIAVAVSSLRSDVLDTTFALQAGTIDAETQSALDILDHITGKLTTSIVAYNLFTDPTLELSTITSWA